MQYLLTCWHVGPLRGYVACYYSNPLQKLLFAKHASISIRFQCSKFAVKVSDYFGHKERNDFLVVCS